MSIFSKKSKILNICAPVNGEVVSVKKVKDETFSENMMGQGFAIIPSDGIFCSPMDGKLSLADNHAYSVEGSDGVQVLVHIGIDTVKLSSKGIKAFKHFKKVGASVKTGDKIVEANLEIIQKNKLDIITPVVVMQETINNKKITQINRGKLKVSTPVFEIK